MQRYTDIYIDEYKYFNSQRQMLMFGNKIKRIMKN